MTGRRLALPAAAVVVGVLGALVGSIVSRQLIEHRLYGDGALSFLLQLVVSGLYLLGSALPILAVVATRLPGVGVGSAFVISVVGVPVNAVVFGSSLNLRAVDLVITFLEVLAVGVVDVVVLLFRGRALPLVAVLLGALAVAVLDIGLTLGRYLTFPGYRLDMLVDVARQPSFLVNVFVLGPVALLAAGLVGWATSRRDQPAAGAGPVHGHVHGPGVVAPPPPPPSGYGPPR